MPKSSRREIGATAVEYATLVALIAAVIIGAVVAIGTATGSAIQAPCTELEAVGRPC